MACICATSKTRRIADWERTIDASKPTAAVLFYRAHLLSGNTAFVDALTDALDARGFNVLAVFTSSLRALDDGVPAALRLIEGRADVLVSTLSFALGEVNAGGITSPDAHVPVFERLGIPVIQAIASGMAREGWEVSRRGLTALETAINVAIPEFDGRLITVPISFKDRSGQSGQSGRRAHGRRQVGRTVRAARRSGRARRRHRGPPRAPASSAAPRHARGLRPHELLVESLSGRQRRRPRRAREPAAPAARDAGARLCDRRGAAAGDERRADGGSARARQLRRSASARRVAGDAVRTRALQGGVRSAAGSGAQADDRLVGRARGARLRAPRSEPARRQEDRLVDQARAGSAQATRRGAVERSRQLPVRGASARQRARRAAAAARLRHESGRDLSHAGFAADASLRGVLSVAGIAARCGRMGRGCDRARRETRDAGVAAGQGRGTVGGVLSRCAARRSAADLSVHRERSGRGESGQAARARADRRSPDAGDDQRGDLRPAGGAQRAGERVLHARRSSIRRSCR